MSLIPCIECENKISEKAKACSQCGAPNNLFLTPNAIAKSKLKSGLVNAIFWCLFLAAISTVGNMNELGVELAILIGVLNSFMLFGIVSGCLFLLYLWRLKFPKNETVHENQNELPFKDYDWPNDDDVKPVSKLFESSTLIVANRVSPIFFDVSSSFRTGTQTWFKLKIQLADHAHDEMICVHSDGADFLIVPSRYEVRNVNNVMKARFVNKGVIQGHLFSDFQKLTSGLKNMAMAANFSHPPPYVLHGVSIISPT